MHIRFHIGAFDATLQPYPDTSGNLKGLPRGIIQDTSDLEFRPLWSPSNLRSKVSIFEVFFFYIMVLFKLTHDGCIWETAMSMPSVIKAASLELADFVIARWWLFDCRLVFTPIATCSQFQWV